MDESDCPLTRLAASEACNRYRNLPDVRDGLTELQRVTLYCLRQIQQETGRESVASIMLWGRVQEHINVSMDELQAVLNAFSGKLK